MILGLLVEELVKIQLGETRLGHNVHFFFFSVSVCYLTDGTYEVTERSFTITQLTVVQIKHRFGS